MRLKRKPTKSIVKRTTTRVGVIQPRSVAATLAFAGPSFADVPANATATSSYGYGYFDSDSQVISIHDSHSDGYGIAIIYYRYDKANVGPYYGWNRAGNGTTTYVYLNMPYGAEIKMYACPEDEGIILEYKCGSRAFGYAGPSI